jgi:hypothetical protein
MLFGYHGDSGPTLKPSPASVKAVKQPHRLAERARQMADGGADADDPIERLDQRGGVGEVAKLVGPGKAASTPYLETRCRVSV